MDELPPAAMAALMKNAAALGPGGAFLARCFAAFDFEGIGHTPPTETFERRAAAARRREARSS